MRRAAPLVLALALATAGCLGAVPEDDTGDPAAPAGAKEAGAGLTRDELSSERIAIAVDAPGWKAYRLNVTDELWQGEWSSDEGRVWFNLSIALDPAAGAEPLLGLGIRLDTHSEDIDPLTNLGFFAFNDTGPHSITSSVTSVCSGAACEGGPPSLEYALIVGTMAGTAEASLGLAGERGGTGPDALLERDRLPVDADHAGEHAYAGTHLVLDNGGVLAEDAGWTAGRIHANLTAPTPRPAGLQAAAEHRITAAAPLPTPGTFTGRLTTSDTVEATPWEINWSLPGASGHEIGATAKAGLVAEGQTPTWSALVDTNAGHASFLLERTATGKADPDLPGPLGLPLVPRVVVATWGFIDESFESLYGWEMREHVASSGVDPSDPVPAGQASGPALAPGVEASVCLPAPEPVCTPQPLHR